MQIQIALVSNKWTLEDKSFASLRVVDLRVLAALLLEFFYIGMWEVWARVMLLKLIANRMKDRDIDLDPASRGDLNALLQQIFQPPVLCDPHIVFLFVLNRIGSPHLFLIFN